MPSNRSAERANYVARGRTHEVDSSVMERTGCTDELETVNSPLTHVFSTTDIVPHERLAFWRDVVCDVFLKLRVEAPHPQSFSGSVTAGRWNDVVISSVTGDAQNVDHGPSDPRNDCLVSVQVTGSGVVTQAGRDVQLSPGDMALYDATRPYRLAFSERFEQVVLQFPRHLLIDRDISIEHSVARVLQRGSGLTDVTTSMVCALARQQSQIPAGVRHRLGSQAIDLVAAALSGAFGGNYEHAGRQAQRTLVVEYVLANLSDPDLSVQTVAEAFGRTTRSLQYVFAGEESLGSTIRRLRLERSAEALVNPMYSRLTIGRIGSMVGFGDPAAFSRAFRRQFDQSPSEVRHAAR